MRCGQYVKLRSYIDEQPRHPARVARTFKALVQHRKTCIICATK